MHIPAFSTDAIIVATMGLVVLYGMLAGYNPLVRESISVYVGLVIASTFGQPIYDYMANQAGNGFAVGQTAVNLSLFFLPIVLLQFVHRNAPHGHHTASYMLTILLAVLASMLMVSSVLTQLDAVTLGHITDGSNLASWIYQLRLVWIGAVPVSIALGAIFRPKHH